MSDGRCEAPEPGSQTKVYTAVLLGPPGVDLQPLSDFLVARGIQPLLPAMALAPGIRSAQDALRRAVEAADVIIAVLTPESLNANVYYELGFAHGLRRQVLILAAPTLDELPADLLTAQYIRVNIDNYEAIDFALDQVLAEHPARDGGGDVAGGRARPIGAISDSLLRRLEGMTFPISERILQQVLSEALRAGGVVVIEEPGGEDGALDLVVWAPELESWLGNPVPIEIKQVFNLNSLEDSKQQLARFLSNRKIRWGVIVFDAREYPAPDFSAGSPYPILLIGPDRVKKSGRAWTAKFTLTNFRESIQSYLTLCTNTKLSLNVRGQALENLAAFLFEQVPGVTVARRNVRGYYKSEEIDLGLMNQNADDGLYVSMFGGLMLVECKNWDDPVGSLQVAWFYWKLRVRGLTSGFLIAMNGITGDPDERSHARDIVSQALTDGIRIIVLTRQDIEALHDASAIQPLILSRMTDLVFGRRSLPER